MGDPTQFSVDELIEQIRAYKLARDLSWGAVAGSSFQKTPQEPGGGEGAPVSTERCAYDPWNADEMMERIRAYMLARDPSRGAVAGSSSQTTPQEPGGGEGAPVSAERCPYDPWFPNGLKFRGDLTLPPIPTKRDWKDTEPGARKCVSLRRLPLAEIDALGRRTFSDLQGSMSRRTVAGLFVLAYNLTSIDGRACFGDVHPDLIDLHNVVELRDVDAMEVIRSNPARGFTASGGGGGGGSAREVQIRCWAYSFLACAYMRLFTKPAEYLSRTAGRLIAGFRSFYGAAVPFRDFLPEPSALFLVKCNLEQELLKNTFYNLLYAGEACPNGKDLKEFLFTTHIALAGLHPYSLFLRCTEALEVLIGRLAAVMRDMWRNHDTVNGVEEVYANLACNPAEDHRLAMWRYARIFDSEFLNHLQTKRRLVFAQTMAQLLTLAAPAGEADGVLKITQIAEMSEAAKTEARRFAQRIYHFVESGKTPQGTSRGTFSRVGEDLRALY